MALLLSIIAKNAANTLLNYSKSYVGSQISKVLSSDFNEYEKELAGVINDTMSKYQKENPQSDIDYTYFFQSQAMVDELMKFRLTGTIDENELINAIEKDDRIVTPKIEEVNKFINYFNKEIERNRKINGLFINDNYKQEVFNLSKTLHDVSIEISNSIRNELKHFKKELQSSFNSQLYNEWSIQLDEIKNHLFQFKPKTALTTLLSLEKRINENGGFSNKILVARINYLKAFCGSEIKGENSDEDANLFISAYNIAPSNRDYMHSAALCFYFLKNEKQAVKIAKELLEIDPYDSVGWLINCYVNESSFKEFYLTVPSQVKKKRDFWNRIYSWFVLTYTNVTAEKINEYNIGFDLEYLEIPEKISLPDRNYWINLSFYAFIQHNQESQIVTRLIAHLDEEEKSQLLRLSNKVLKKITEALVDSEIADNYRSSFFTYYYTKFLLEENENDIFLMEKYYSKIKQKSLLFALAMAHCYAAIRSEKSVLDAIAIIKSYGELNEDISFSSGYYYLMINKADEAYLEALQYLDKIQVVEQRQLYNILRFLSLYRTNETDKLRNLVNTVINKQFESPVLKEMFKVINAQFISETISGTDIISILVNSSKGLSENSSLEYFIAIGYLKHEQIDLAIEYLKGYIDFEKPSPDLKIYCKALFKSTQPNKIELLSILEKWRKLFYVDHELLEIELYLKESQNKWVEAFDIAELGFKTFNTDRFLAEVFYCAISNNLDIVNIEKYAKQNPQ